jgi:hypothetical protein
MRFSLYAPGKSLKKGAFRIAITGEELKTMTGQYLPNKTTRATIRREPGEGNKYSIKIDKAGHYAVSPTPNSDKTGKALADFTTAQIGVSLIEDYGLKAPAENVIATITPKFSGQTMIFELPMQFFSVRPAALGARKDVPQNGTNPPLMTQVKEAINSLNSLLAKVPHEGFEVNLTFEGGKISGKAVRKQDIDL